MSKDYFPIKRIPFDEVRSLLGEVNVDNSAECQNDNQVCLTNGEYFMWAYRNGNSTMFTRFGLNDEEAILMSLGKTFNTTFTLILSEIDEGLNNI